MTVHSADLRSLTLARPDALDAAFAPLFEERPVRRLRDGAALFAEGDERSHLFRVREGLATRLRHLPDGTRHVVGFAEPGAIIGLGLCGAEHGETVEAAWRFAYQAAPMEAVAARLRARPDFAFDLVAEATRQAREMEDLFVRRAHYPSHRMLADFLLRLRDAIGETPEGVLPLPLLRSAIADHLGFSAETASRAFTRLRELGLVDHADRSDARILDLPGLTALASGASAA
jgi:CRP-like cAMP-binding protein